MAPISTPPELTAIFGIVADDSRSALERLLVGTSLRMALDHHLTELAQSAREEEGHSWADVGGALDITRQAAQQRFGKVDAIRVDLDGTVGPTDLREEHLDSLREQLAKLSGYREKPGDELTSASDALSAIGDRLAARAPGDSTLEIRPVVVEIEVEVPVDEDGHPV